jgi:hypothetical protein
MVISKYIANFIVISTSKVAKRINTIDTILDTFPNSIESAYPIDFYYNQDVIICGNSYTVGNVDTEIIIEKDTVHFIRNVEITLIENGFANADDFDADDFDGGFEEAFF